MLLPHIDSLNPGTRLVPNVSMTDLYEGEHYRRRLTRALLEPYRLPQPAHKGDPQGAELDADTIEYFISGVRRRQQQVLPDISVAAETTSTDVDDIRPDGEAGTSFGLFLLLDGLEDWVMEVNMYFERHDDLWPTFDPPHLVAPPPPPPPASQVTARMDVGSRGSGEPPRALVVMLSDADSQDVAPVELLRWAGGLLGLPVHAAHLLSSGHTHLLGPSEVVYVRLAGIDRPLYVGRDLRSMVICRGITHDGVAPDVHLPIVGVSPAGVIWHPRGYARTMLEVNEPAYSVDEWAAMARRLWDPEGSLSSAPSQAMVGFEADPGDALLAPLPPPSLPIGISSLEEWAIMLLNQEIRARGARQRHAGKPSGGLEAVDDADPASLELLHASVVRLVGAAKTRSVFRGLFHHAYVDLVQMMGPALAAEIGKAAERLGWDSVAEDVLFFLTQDQTIRRAGIGPTIQAVKQLVSKNARLTSFKSEGRKFMGQVADAVIRVYLQGSTEHKVAVPGAAPSGGGESRGDTACLEDDREGEGGSPSEEDLAVARERLAEFNDLASFVARDVASTEGDHDSGDSGRLMLRLYDGITQELARFPAPTFLLPLLSEEQAWEDWANEYGIAGLERLMLCLVIDHPTTIEEEPELLQIMADRFLERIDPDLLAKQVWESLTDPTRAPLQRAASLRVLGRLIRDADRTEALEHVGRVYEGACESIVRHLLSLLTDPVAGVAKPRPSLLKAPQATQTADAKDEPPYIAHVREAMGLLPVVWDACEPLQPLMRQWLDPPSTNGEGWAEREVVTIRVALEIVKQVLAADKVASVLQSRGHPMWALLACAALRSKWETKLLPPEALPAILTVLYRTGQSDLLAADVLTRLINTSRSIWGSDVIAAVVKVAQANTEVLTYPAFRALCTLRLTKLEDIARRVGREPRKGFTGCMCADCVAINEFFASFEMQRTFPGMLDTHKLTGKQERLLHLNRRRADWRSAWVRMLVAQQGNAVQITKQRPETCRQYPASTEAMFDDLALLLTHLNTLTNLPPAAAHALPSEPAFVSMYTEQWEGLEPLLRQVASNTRPFHPPHFRRPPSLTPPARRSFSGKAMAQARFRVQPPPAAHPHHPTPQLPPPRPHLSQEALQESQPPLSLGRLDVPFPPNNACRPRGPRDFTDRPRRHSRPYPAPEFTGLPKRNYEANLAALTSSPAAARPASIPPRPMSTPPAPRPPLLDPRLSAPPQAALPPSSAPSPPSPVPSPPRKAKKKPRRNGPKRQKTDDSTISELYTFSSSSEEDDDDDEEKGDEVEQPARAASADMCTAAAAGEPGHSEVSKQAQDGDSEA